MTRFANWTERKRPLRPHRRRNGNKLGAELTAKKQLYLWRKPFIPQYPVVKRLQEIPLQTGKNVVTVPGIAESVSDFNIWWTSAPLQKVIWRVWNSNMQALMGTPVLSVMEMASGPPEARKAKILAKAIWDPQEGIPITPRTNQLMYRKNHDADWNAGANSLNETIHRSPA